MEFFFGIFDNDPNDNLPNLVAEHTSLESCVSGHVVDEKFSAYLPYNINTIDILEERINQYQDVITYFHFSGHQGKGLIKLNQNEVGIAKLIERLNSLPRLKFAFFNGCCTAEHLKGKLDNVPFVIGTNVAIHDKVATQYSKFLYERLFSKIENLNDFEEISQAIDHSMESAFESLSGTGDGSDVDLLKTRGVATRELFTSNVFQIVNSNKDIFDERKVMEYDKDSYPVNDILKSHYEQIGSDNSFYKDYPNFIARLLLPFVKDQAPQKKLGTDRFYQIKKLVQTYMVFCKSCIASIIWTGKMKNERDLLLDLLTIDDLPSFEVDVVDKLIEVTNAIAKNKMEDDQKIIVDLILESKNFFQSVKEISEKEPNDTDEDFPLFLLADQVLHNFILETRALVSFQFHSIADIYFHNFIFSEKQNVEFGIKRYTKQPALRQAAETEPIFTNLKDLKNQAYSVHLIIEPKMDKVLNLKPFIIDWFTISDDKEETIQYCFISNIHQLKNQDVRNIEYKNFDDINEINADSEIIGRRTDDLNNKQRILREHYDTFIKFLTSA